MNASDPLPGGPRRRTKRLVTLAAAGVCILAALAATFFFRHDRPKPPSSTEKTPSPPEANALPEETPTPADTLDPVVRVDLGDNVILTFVLIHPGSFTMGSPATEAGRDPDETPRTVQIAKPFYMSQTEVTGEQLARFDERSRLGGRNTRPALRISPETVLGRCRLLTKRIGRVVRLPGEAEWEYACRAGAQTPWNTGAGPEDLDRAAWYGGRSWAVPAAQFRPNAWGLYDMHGNAGELCRDESMPDLPKPVVAGTEWRPSPWIVRGGAYNLARTQARSASRGRMENIGWAAGYRLVMEVEPERLSMKLPARYRPMDSEDVALRRCRADLDRGVDVNARVTPQGAWLDAASAGGYVRLARFLLSKGADANPGATTRTLWTPLHSAALCGRTEIIRLLLAAGADANVKDEFGRTALSYAFEAGRRDAGILLADGVPPAALPLQDAIAGGDVELVRILLAKGAEVNPSAPFPGILASSPLACAMRAAEQTSDPDRRKRYEDVVLLLLGQAAEADLSMDPYASSVTTGPRVGGMRLNLGRKVIHAAAEYGFVRAVRVCLEKGADVNGKDPKGRTPLHLAAAAGDSEIAGMLLAKGADVNAADPENALPIHAAAGGGNPGVISLILAKGATTLEARDRAGRTPLMAAAEAGQREAVRLLIDKGANVNATTPTGSGLLHLAVSHGDRVLLDLLYAKGFDPKKDAASRGRDSALAPAIRARNRAAIDWLIEKGADVNAVDASGGTPLLAAAPGRDPALIAHLISRGADVRRANRNGETLLHVVMGWADPGLTEALIAAGADVNAKDGKGRNALSLAASHGRPDTVDFLIDRSSDLNVKDANGEAALLSVLKKGWAAQARHLIDKGVDVNVRDREERTPLHYAARGRDAEVVRMLVAKGADAHARAKDGATAIDEAAARGGPEVVETLLRGDNLKTAASDGRTLLHDAARNGNVDATKRLIAAGLDINARDEKGNTPLHACAGIDRSPRVYGDGENLTTLARLLIEAGSDPLAKNQDGKAPLAGAMERDDAELTALLRSRGAVPAPADYAHKHVLGVIWRGDAEGLQEILRARPDLANARESAEGDPVLFWAIQVDRADMVAALLDAGADVNATAKYRGSPLDAAIRLGNARIVRRLVEKGADVNAVKPGDFSNPLIAAERAGLTEIAEFLKSKGATATLPGETLTAALAAAVKAGNVAEARRRLKQGADVNGRDAAGGVPLYWAVVQQGRTCGRAMVELLIASGADVNAGRADGETPLDMAILLGRAGVAKTLLEKGAKVDSAFEVDSRSGGLLHKAVSDEAFGADVIALMLEHGADANAKTRGGATALVVALEKKRADVARLLVEKGADPKVAGPRRETLLHAAVMLNDRKLAETALSHGLSPNELGCFPPTTPLHLAVQAGNKEMTGFLIEKGADPLRESFTGTTPMTIAVTKGPADLVALMLDKGGVDVNRKNRFSRTLLHDAVEFGPKEVVALLLARGADPNARDHNQDTPLHTAAGTGNAVAVEALVAKGAKIDLRGGNKRTALLKAILGGHAKVAAFLLEKGADVTIADEESDLPLPAALRKNLQDTADLLRKHGAR